MRAKIERIELNEAVNVMCATIADEEEQNVFILQKVSSSTTLKDLSRSLQHDGILVTIEDEPELVDVAPVPEEPTKETKKETKETKKEAKKVELDMGKVKALRNAGWSYDKIGEEFGVTGVTISNRLKAEGYK